MLTAAQVTYQKKARNWEHLWIAFALPSAMNETVVVTMQLGSNSCRSKCMASYSVLKDESQNAWMICWTCNWGFVVRSPAGDIKTS